MKELYAGFHALPDDALLALCIAIGVVWRLSRDEHLTFLGAIKEMVWTGIAGMMLTGLALWASNMETRSAWFLAIGLTYFAGLLVEIIEKRGTELRDMSWAETLHLIFDEITTRIKNFTTKTPS